MLNSSGSLLRASFRRWGLRAFLEGRESIKDWAMMASGRMAYIGDATAPRVRKRRRYSVTRRRVTR
jgi:hypothetical protein